MKSANWLLGQEVINNRSVIISNQNKHTQHPIWKVSQSRSILCGTKIVCNTTITIKNDSITRMYPFEHMETSSINKSPVVNRRAFFICHMLSDSYFTENDHQWAALRHQAHATSFLKRARCTLVIKSFYFYPMILQPHMPTYDSKI